MAKKNETAVAKTEENKTIAPIPDDLKAHAGHGTEGINNDFRPARLLVAQSLSPQVKRSDPKYVAGLREGHLFNDLTGEIYNQDPEDADKLQPVEFVVVRCMGARGIHFRSREEGGGVIDGNVPLTDPRMEFTEDPNDPTKRIKPIATKFYDYVIWLPETSEMMALSMKGSQLKAGFNLNSLIKQPLRIDGNIMMVPPAWARVFLLGTAEQKNDKGIWTGVTIRPKGITPQEIREACALLFDSLKDKNVVIDYDDEPEGAEAATHTAKSGADEDVPF